MGQMEHVMVAIPVAYLDIVGQRSPDEDAVPLQVGLATWALPDRDLEAFRKALVRGKELVERRQTGRGGFEETSAGLTQVSGENDVEVDVGSLKRGEVSDQNVRSKPWVRVSGPLIESSSPVAFPNSSSALGSPKSRLPAES